MGAYEIERVYLIVVPLVFEVRKQRNAVPLRSIPKDFVGDKEPHS